MYLKLMKYPGSKTVLLPEIKRLFHLSGSNMLVDVFGGSGLVSLNLGAQRTVYNDIDAKLVNIFTAIQNDPELIKAMLYEVLKFVSTEDRNKMSFRGWLLANSMYHGRKLELIESLYLYTTGFGGMGSTYATKNEKSKGAFIKKTLANFGKIQASVHSWSIENLDFRKLFEKYHSSEAFFYLDPPYSEKAWYNYNLARNDYLDLKSILFKLGQPYLMNIDLMDKELLDIFEKPKFVRRYANENGKPGRVNDRMKAFYTNIPGTGGNL
ncbi:MAG: DNA adenine methylase [Thermoplasmatales archaeon]|nr:DNA adenine methylase [Thermoplasmatales archaeon]MCW6170899.1 DNA adenine methylase [Thermoplasmatales archaeon]